MTEGANIYRLQGLDSEGDKTGPPGARAHTGSGQKVDAETTRHGTGNPGPGRQDLIL
jgi:hypothetical protein